MTSPATTTAPPVVAPPPVALQPQDPAFAAQRLVAASQATGGNHPQLATILANSGISDSQMATIGGFAQATKLATANRLAAESGATTNFDTRGLNALQAMGEQTPTQPPPPSQGDPRNWLEKAVDAVGGALSTTGSFLFNNPVSHGVLSALNWLGDAAHMPVRMLSAAIGGEDTQARDAEMQALGYDPTSEISKLAFMWNHGEGEYHSLDSVRQSTDNGAQMVDLAVRMQTDPDGYSAMKQSLAADPNNLANVQKLKDLTTMENSSAFKQVFGAVDAQHISPGRDLAGLLFAPFGGKTANNTAFNLMSGVLDGLYTWYSDPFMTGAKVVQGVRAADVLGRDAGIMATIADSNPVFRAMRSGLESISDQNGIRAALGVDESGQQVATTAASKFWEGARDVTTQWLDAAKTAQDATLTEAERAAAKVQEGQLYNQLNQQYKAAIPVIPEIAGLRIALPDDAVRWNEMGGLDKAATVEAAQARMDAGQLSPDLFRAIVNGDTEVLHNPRMNQPVLAVVKDLASAKPMQDLGELADSFISTNGLLRLNGGFAAQNAILMPGRLSYTAMAKAAVVGKATDVGQKFLDYTNPAKLLAHPAEQAGTDLLETALAAKATGNLDAAAQAGRDAKATMQRGTTDATPLADAGADATGKTADGTPVQVGLSGFNLAKYARARVERTVRRLTSMQPGTQLIDLTDSNSVQQVRNYARFFLNKYDSDRLASSYATGNLAQRRQILAGITMQNLHASGVMESEGGQAFAQRFFADNVGEVARKYGYGKTSQIATEAGPRDVALVPSQLSDHVVIPSFRELHYYAGKFAVSGFASKVGLASTRAAAEGHFMDNLMHAVKLGWITTAAGGLRNSLEESLTAIAKGLGPTMLQGRVAWTQATQQYREDLRDTSKYFQGWIDQYGRAEAERMRTERIGNIRADGTANPDDRYKAMLLERAISHRIPLMFRGAIDHMNDAVIGSVLGKALSYNKDLKITPQLLEWAGELKDPELTSILREGVFQSKIASAAVDGDDEAMQLANAGIQHRPYGFVGMRPDGWQQVELDGGAGIDAYSKYLGQMFNDAASPAHPWAQTMQAQLKAGKDIGTAADEATKAVRAYADDPAMQHFVNNAEVMNTLNNGTKVAHADPAALENLRSTAKDQYAQRLSANLLEATGRRAGATTGATPGVGSAVKDAQDKLDKLLAAKTAAATPAAKTATSGGQQFIQQIGQGLAGAFNPDMARQMWANEARLTGRTYEEVARADIARIAAKRGLDPADLARDHGVAWNGKGATIPPDQKLAPAAAPAATTAPAAAAAVAPTDAEIAAAKKALAAAKKANPAAAGQVISPALLDRLVKAKTWGAPDRQWLASELKMEDLPSHVIQQRWAPYNPAHAPGEMPSGYTGALTTAYKKVALDQINATTRNPLTTGLYMRARERMLPYEQHLIDSGWDEDLAKKTASRMALSQAQEEVFRHIDNPYVGTQFSTIARNFWAFERFQEDYLRRWGRTLRDNPEIIRKAQLAIHGGQSTGMVEKDSQGNLTFIYPGSGLAINVFNKAFAAMGLGAQVQIPIHGDLSSQLQFVNASLENPFGFSGTPLLSVPFHAMAATVGADHPILMASLDKAINGNLGAGKSWWENMLPSWANRIYSGVISTDPASKYGSAYANALFNAEAAGQLPKIDGTYDPVTKTWTNGTNATAIANFQRTLSVQIRNNLALEALFGFFSPAAPTLNEKVDPTAGFQGDKADFSAHLQGLQSLKDEAQKLLQTMPYAQFKTYWQATHPHELIYNQSGAGARTVVGSASAYEPADLTAARWMQDNNQFVHDYGGKGGLASYFLPSGQPGTTGGTYSDIARRAELENGMRQYKSLEDIWKDIIVARGEDIYYRAKDSYDAGIGNFDAGGHAELTRQQQQAWTQVKDSIFAGNPLLAEKFGQAGAQDVRTSQVSDLQKMLDDKSPTTQAAIGPNRPGVEALVQNWVGYQQKLADLQGSRLFVSAHQTAQLNADYATALRTITQQFPQLQGLANGVFRSPN